VFGLFGSGGVGWGGLRCGAVRCGGEEGEPDHAGVHPGAWRRPWEDSHADHLATALGWTIEHFFQTALEVGRGLSFFEGLQAGRFGRKTHTLQWVDL
jgi:hypothetical protein